MTSNKSDFTGTQKAGSRQDPDETIITASSHLSYPLNHDYDLTILSLPDLPATLTYIIIHGVTFSCIGSTSLLQYCD